MALMDEMQKYNPKPNTFETESKQTIPAQSTRIIQASISVSNDHPITGTVQTLPQFDECSKIILAPAITTATDKRSAIKTANTSNFPYTVTLNTKFADSEA